MSIHQLYHISKRSFASFDAAMNTIGQNVANANTEGYSRRRISLQADSTVNQGFQTKALEKTANGTGVSVSAYERLRDALLSRSTWHANSWMGGSEEEHRITTTLQSIFTSETDGSLSSQLDHFWNSWSDLADNPTDNGVRMSVRGQGASIAATLSRTAADIEHLQSETVRAIEGGIQDVNRVLEEVAELNGVIQRSHALGSPDLDAEDRRDLLVNELSEQAAITIQEESDGGYTVLIDGIMVVSDSRAKSLELDTSGGMPEVKIADTPISLKVPAEGGGRLGGWLRTLQSTLPDALASLDAIAEALVKEINTVHTTGHDLDGNTGVAFFHYDAGPPESGVTASSIRLSDAVNDDSRAIVASAGDPSDGVNDSEVANDIFRLSEAGLMNGGTETIESYAINLVTGIGATARRASSLYESHAALANQVDAMAKGVSGVSLEEEMTDLIRYQQSFAAAARVLNSAEAMMESLLTL